MATEKCESTLEGCDIFDFMAKHIGLMVIHLGGYKANRVLLDACHVDKKSRVLDIICGKGTSANHFAEKYGCEVVGTDISEKLIADADFPAEKKGLTRKVTFRVGGCFGLTISQK
jgi:cyclopropane fatty-acyl-phospholipid synthase-like methyltransferase